MLQSPPHRCYIAVKELLRRWGLDRDRRRRDCPSITFIRTRRCPSVISFKCSRHPFWNHSSNWWDHSSKWRNHSSTTAYSWLPAYALHQLCCSSSSQWWISVQRSCSAEALTMFVSSHLTTWLVNILTIKADNRCLVIVSWSLELKTVASFSIKISCNCSQPLKLFFSVGVQMIRLVSVGVRYYACGLVVSVFKILSTLLHRFHWCNRCLVPVFWFSLVHRNIGSKTKITVDIPSKHRTIMNTFLNEYS